MERTKTGASSGSWPPGAASSSFPSSASSTALEITRLLLLGASAVVVHGLVRGRLGLGPGHQGAVWIVMLIVGRSTSGLPWAGVTSGLGAAATAMLPFWGFGDPFRWLAYLLAGTVVDLACLSSRQWRRRLWILIPLGGLAHATKPVLRAWITGAAGWPYESLLGGLAYPTWSHAAFGMLGAAVGVAVVASRSRRG